MNLTEEIGESENGLSEINLIFVYSTKKSEAGTLWY